MPLVVCPACGHRGNTPTNFRGHQLKCSRCGKPFQVEFPETAPRRRWLARTVSLVLGLILFLAVGVGSFLAFSYVKDWIEAQRGNEPEQVEEPPPPTEKEKTPDDDEKKAEREAKRKAGEAKRLELERKKKDEEEKQRQLEAEKKKDQERREQEAREEQRKKEEEAKREAERLLVLKKNPTVTAMLEDIERAPDKYYGQYLTVKDVAIKPQAIDRNKDLARFTIGVSSERGKYYSRVPLGGLLVSTGDKIGGILQKTVDESDNYHHFKLYAEIRKWQRKSDPNRDYPEVFIYKIEIYRRSGALYQVLEE
jgi:hypothetical protein